MEIENLKAHKEWVIIECDDEQQQTSGGIIIPDTAKEYANMGKVITCGKGSRLHPMNVQPGDRVAWQQYDGEHWTIDGKIYTAVKIKDIVAIL